MVPECSYLYPDGRNCRRTPRRGESLCRDHRRHAAAVPGSDPDEEAFYQQLFQFNDQVSALPLDRMLLDLVECLSCLQVFVEAKASSMERTRYHHAVILATAALDCVLAQPRVFAEMFSGVTPQQALAIVQTLYRAEPRFLGEVPAGSVAAR